MNNKYVTTQNILGIPQGKRVVIRCPSENHRDSTPSFAIYKDGGFHCFGCGLHGNNGLDFLIRVLGNSYIESIRYQLIV